MADPAALAALAGLAPPRSTVPPPGRGDLSVLLERLRAARTSRPPLVLTPPSQHAPAQKKQPKRNILGQLRDVVTGLPAGVGHLALSAGRSIVNVPTTLTGHNWKGEKVDVNRPDVLTAGVFTKGATPGGFEQWNPLGAETGASFHRTAMDVRHPTNYARAYREGEIVNKVLEDVANASIVGGVAASALRDAAAAASASGNVARAEALSSIASKVDRTAHLGGRVANIPGKPYQYSASLLRQGLESGLERGLPALGERVPTLAEHAPTIFTQEGRAGRLRFGQAETLGRREEAVLHRQGRRLEQGGELGAPSAAEQEAAYASIVGQQAMEPALARTGVTPEEMRSVLAPSRIPGAHLSAEGQRIAAEFAADPASHPRVQALVDAIRQRRDVETARGVQGGAAWAGSLEALQSTDMLPVARAAMERELRGAQSSAEIQSITDYYTNDPASYAPIWRPRMMEAERARQTLLARGDTAGAAAVPHLPTELEAAGVNPEYLPHGRPLSSIPKAERLQMAARNQGALGDIALSSEHRRGLNPEAPMSVQGLYEGWGREARNLELRNAYRSYVSDYGKTAADVLGPDRLAEIERGARAEAAARFPNGKAEAGAEFYRLRGEALRSAMAEQGLEAWPTKGMAKADIAAADIAPDTPFLRAGLRDRLAKQWTVPAKPPWPLALLQRINKGFKGAVLPWSIRWQVGDAVSIGLLGWTAGDVNPLQLASAMKQLRNLSPEAKALMETEVPSSGLTYGEHLSLDPAQIAQENPALGIRHPIKTLQAPGFALNRTINRIGREAFTLEHLNRLLSEHNMTIDDAARTPHTPEVRQAMRDAVQKADHALGAYDNMTPFEKRWVREIFPFWSWIRTITRISAAIAIDDPLRAVWIMRIGSLGTDPHSPLPDPLRGQIQTPFGRIDSNFLNAFADPTAQSILTPEGALRSLSPGIKVAAAAGLGIDLNRTGLPLSRPFDTGRTDPYGRVANTPLILRPAELAYFISQQTPQTRAAVNLAPRVNVAGVQLGPVARYAQGSQVNRGKTGEPLDVNPRWQEALRLASIPQPYSERDINDILASIRRRKG